MEDIISLDLIDQLINDKENGSKNNTVKAIDILVMLERDIIDYYSKKNGPIPLDCVPTGFVDLVRNDPKFKESSAKFIMQHNLHLNKTEEYHSLPLVVAFLLSSIIYIGRASI
ncbi:MAG: hypothetical protein FJW63_10315 [Actinobacteria bacterium]|nr:hypothetical protein [Actinomycetota bacterium]